MAERTCSVDQCDGTAKTRGMCGKHAERVRKWGDPHCEGAVIVGDDVRRFWSKVDQRDLAKCWRWQGTVLTNGYGQFVVGGRKIPAHRYAYELSAGPIPEGMEIDHVKARGCMFTDCVNPSHLEAVPPLENLMRSDAYSAVNARKTHCIRGHKFDRVITRSDGRLRRRCTTCHRMKTAEAARAKRAMARA